MTIDPMTGRVHWRPPWWVGDLIAAALIVSAVFLPFPGEEFSPTTPLGVAIVIAPAALLPFRRRWPSQILVACVVLYGAAALTGILAPGVILGVAVAMFAVSNRFPRRVSMIAAAIVVIAIIGLSVLAAIGSVFDPRVIQFAVIIAFAAAAGDGAKSRREFIAAVTERAERAEQTRESEARRRVSEERLRIARDLHDAVAHQISVISLNAGVASSALESRPEAAKEALASIRTASRAVLGEIGDLLAVLRADDDPGAVAVPQPGLGRLDELIDTFRASGLDVTTRYDGTITPLPAVVDMVAYRVIQEALTNANKHGTSQRAHLLLTYDHDFLHIVVTNPVGPTVAADARDELPGGNGLVGMRERVATVRGTVDTGPTPGGYRVSASLPLPSKGDQ
jgi:signal transduction histidine kinase